MRTIGPWSLVPLTVILWLGGRSSTAPGALGLAAASLPDSPPIVRILQPVPGTPVTSHPVLVRGTVEPPNADVRITVNRRPVFLVQNGEWAILIDLAPGLQTLTAEVVVGSQVIAKTETKVTVMGPLPESWPLVVSGIWWHLGRKRVPIGTPPLTQSFYLDRYCAYATSW